MMKIDCPACGTLAAAEQAMCPLCHPARHSPSGQEQAFERTNLRHVLENECPACGARLDSEKPLCPICSGTKKKHNGAAESALE